mmetsp:Transcript_24328/g.27144  ORF Transcript_24328/g.27144 Transcript_24328/m.27144 type:complete len:363 (+) Transcript_24328:102-1190(+)
MSSSMMMMMMRLGFRCQQVQTQVRSHRFLSLPSSSLKNKNNLNEKKNEEEGGTNDGHHDYTDDEDSNKNLLLMFSSIVETPIDSTIIEKPFTMIFMEENKNYLTNSNDIGTKKSVKNDVKIEDDKSLSISWIDTFRSKIPREYGMSFASISIHRKNHCRDDVGGGDAPVLLFDELLKALKVSELPTINDTVLIARGPVASLCAQYYLESLSLKGLIMIDPILINDEKDDYCNDDDDDTVTLLRSKVLFTIVGTTNITERFQNDDDQDRFRSSRLLIEPNAVPMMVVLTVPNDEVWNRSSRFVATRHSNPDGPYGMVEIVDLTTEKKKNENENKIFKKLESGLPSSVMMITLDQINHWIDVTL